MANSLLTPSEITRIPLMVAHSTCRFGKAVDKSYADEFANDSKSMAGKIGKTLQSRLPNKYLVRTGTAMQVQAHTEQSTALTVGTEIGIDSEFYDSEESLLVTDYEKRYAEPMGKTISSTVDADLASMYTLIYNAVLVDTSTQVNQVKTILQGKQKLNEALVPSNDALSLLIPPVAESYIAPQYTNLYNPQANISQMFTEGVISTANGMSWYMDQNMPVFTTGSRLAGTTAYVGTTATEAATTLNIKNDGTHTIMVGDTFTIVGVNAVNPETKASTGSLAQFVVQPGGATGSPTGWTANATYTGGGYYTFNNATNITINVDRPFYSSASGGLQNVTALPTAGATNYVTWLGTASTAYAQLVLLHKTAAAMAMVKLPVFPNQGKMIRSSYDGMSLRYWRNGDITNGRQLSRFDALYGKAMPRPEWAARLYLAI